MITARTLISIAMLVALATSHANATSATLICKLTVMNAAYDEKGNVGRTSVQERTRVLIVEEEKIATENNLQFNSCARDEFFMKCSGGYYATTASQHTHFLSLSRVSGEIDMQAYLKNATGTLTNFTHEIGVCEKTNRKLF